ncbi:hypothetical protein HPB48_021363 [Haemaphysalis longicornis]|uniref:Uncharacterized protein n=1 Tax=Haemaphysalis longicornis TaxID=44386 RepID=A0A9J6FN83_HAELO|nr:hypothetical protein HPB48_021363 [Haemaphysalis longicornis]
MKGKKLCNALNLSHLAKAIDNSKRHYIEVFCSGKTHKVDLPLRAIVSDNGTWIESIALFLQKKLSMLPVADPYIV